MQWLRLFCQILFSDCRLVTPRACLSSESVTTDNVASHTADSFPPDVMPWVGSRRTTLGMAGACTTFWFKIFIFHNSSHPLLLEPWYQTVLSRILHGIWNGPVNENMFHRTWTFQDGAYTKPPPVLNSAHDTERHATDSRGKRWIPSSYKPFYLQWWPARLTPWHNSVTKVVEFIITILFDMEPMHNTAHVAKTWH